MFTQKCKTSLLWVMVCDSQLYRPIHDMLIGLGEYPASEFILHNILKWCARKQQDRYQDDKGF